MEKALSYQDIYCVPEYSEVSSRKLVDTSLELFGVKYKLPVIPANMESVIDEDIAEKLSRLGYFYIMHRFGNNDSFIQRASDQNWPLISISVGVNDSDKNFIDWVERGVNSPSFFQRKKLRVDYITIDIAHGHCKKMREMIEFIRSKLPRVKIIAGNVATARAVFDLASWGADIVKVGIAGGGVCSTKTQTGFHVPMATCIMNCARDFATGFPHNIPIIADGGIREHGDIAKALALGATAVMAGGLFAACIDSPATDIHDSVREMKVVKKIMWGSASARQKKKNEHVEGFELAIPCNGLTYVEKMVEIKENLQSAISYSGGFDLTALKKVKTISIK